MQHPTATAKGKGNYKETHMKTKTQILNEAGYATRFFEEAPDNYGLLVTQLEEFPDSVVVSVDEAFSWIRELPKDYEESMRHWENTYGVIYCGIELKMARDFKAHMLVNEHQLHVARAIATTKQWEVGFFYKCGLRPDGSYAWRGYRFGIEPHEYMSGFGRY